jgi:CRISPR-associated exonuclease Cas4
MKKTQKSKIKKQDIINMLEDKSIIPHKHPDISGVTVIGDINSFPVSWLQKREYCEYQIFMEHFKKIKAAPTQAMIIGSKEHHRLEAEFKVDAEPATFEEMLALSFTHEVYSRELPIISFEYGIHGLIDEIIMTPEFFMIIDDKPGTKAYTSSIHQVYGYCLAFKEMIGEELNNKKIFGALRERGTDNIYWQNPFDEKAQKEITTIIKRMQGLIKGNLEFKSTDNPNKCRSCRFVRTCDQKKI